MKKIKNILSVVLFMFVSFTLSSQNCNFYYPLEEGRTMQLKSYSADDKLKSIQEVTIKDVKGSGDDIEATLETRVFNAQRSLLYEGSFGVSCTGNNIKVDIQSLIDPTMLEGFKDMEVSMELNDLVIPADLNIGDILPEANMKINISMEGMSISNMELTVKERKVEGKESITTPAGTFSAYKISQNSSFTFEAPMMGINQSARTKTIEYLVRDKGAVRTETYDENGNLLEYVILSKIE